MIKMTVEDAIKELKQLEFCNRPFDNSAESCEKIQRCEQAVLMAISALEQEAYYKKKIVELYQELSDAYIDIAIKCSEAFKDGYKSASKNKQNFITQDEEMRQLLDCLTCEHTADDCGLGCPKKEQTGDAVSREAVIKLIQCSEYELQDRVDNDAMCDDIRELPSVTPKLTGDVVSRILKRMWNCRGKHTTSIDKVKMEQIIRDELSYDADIEYSQNMDNISKPTGIKFYDEDVVSRDAVLMCLTGEFVLDKEYKPEELIAVFSKRIKKLPFVTVRQTHNCNTCEYEEDRDSGECYECVKGIQDWYKPKQTVWQTKHFKHFGEEYVTGYNQGYKDGQTQVRQTGEWIEHPHEVGPCLEYSRYECSECHEWAEDDSDFCPYCGVDMRGAENGK